MNINCERFIVSDCVCYVSQSTADLSIDKSYNSLLAAQQRGGERVNGMAGQSAVLRIPNRRRLLRAIRVVSVLVWQC